MGSPASCAKDRFDKKVIRGRDTVAGARLEGAARPDPLCKVFAAPHNTGRTFLIAACVSRSVGPSTLSAARIVRSGRNTGALTASTPTRAV